MPVLIQVAEEYKSRGVVLYAVNQRELPDEISRLLVANNWNLSVVIDPKSQFAEAYGVDPIPQLFFIGKDGTILRSHVGLTSEKILRKELDAILATTPQSAAGP